MKVLVTLLFVTLLIFAIMQSEATQTPLNSAAFNNTVTIEDSLKATGATDTLLVKSLFSAQQQTPNTLIAQYKMIDVDTYAGVRIEGSLDGTNWFQLIGKTTRAYNDTTGYFLFEGVSALYAFRGNFFEESGGTAAIIVFKWKFGD